MKGGLELGVCAGLAYGIGESAMKSLCTGIFR